MTWGWEHAINCESKCVPPPRLGHFLIQITPMAAPTGGIAHKSVEAADSGKDRTFTPMQNTPTDLYRDAIAMAVADNLPQEQIKQANLIATTGSEFNIAIWAAIRLQEIV